MSEITTSAPFTIDEWRQHVTRIAPRLEDMALSIPRHNPEYTRVVETPLRLINFLSGGTQKGLEESCQGYIKFCDIFFEKQLHFIRKREYKASDFEQVNADVYQNTEYMSRVYYPALLLSYLFSSNYFSIYRNFREKFIPAVQGTEGHSCEIGIGHGLLSASLLSSSPKLIGHGLDISPVAVEVTNRVSAFFDLRHPIATQVADATKDIPLHNVQAYKVMICAEVLEHLPDPARLLRNMNKALAYDGLLFLTASINMESVDHLYLFHSDDEVIQMVEECGFEVVDRDLAFLTTHDYRGNADIRAKLVRQANPATSVLIIRKSRNL